MNQEIGRRLPSRPSTGLAADQIFGPNFLLFQEYYKKVGSKEELGFGPAHSHGMRLFLAAHTHPQPFIFNESSGQGDLLMTRLLLSSVTVSMVGKKIPQQMTNCNPIPGLCWCRFTFTYGLCLGNKCRENRHQWRES